MPSPPASLQPAARCASRLHVVLIRPTTYDDDGYPLRHFRGVLPTNSLACMNALTESLRRRHALAPLEIRCELVDETVQALPMRRLRALARRRGSRVLIGLVGVQTNQFPRATELARRFRSLDCAVVIGGFHVSGSLKMLPAMPPELRALQEEGVSLASGEFEEQWETILRDAAAGTLRPLYDATTSLPELARAPVPTLDPRLMKRFVYRHFGTLETTRGCPFTCSFCTIINVQGRTMRHRDAAHVAAAIAENFRRTGTAHYFFTDDNLSRSRHWRDLFTQLIRLREEEGIPLRFLMQVDTLSHKIPDLIPMARRAGCFQVFIGMESVNPDSLRDGGKRQNRVSEYRALIAAWHDAGILTHVGYIIGFAHDDPDSVRADLHTLQSEIRPDLAAFFMLTPLPGSVDHLRLVQAGTPLDADLNRYDTFHPVVDHPRMSGAEWFSLYREAWQTFYGFDYMRRRVGEAAPAQRVTLLQMYLWYTACAFVENAHPMMSGFFRLKPRAERRPGLAVPGRWAHARKRLPEVLATVAGYACVLRQLRDIWWATLPAPPAARGTLTPRWTPFLRAMFGSAAQPRQPCDYRAAASPPPYPRTVA